MISSVQPVTQLKKPENTSHQRLESDRERQGTGVDEGEEKKKTKMEDMILERAKSPVLSLGTRKET